MPPRRVFTILSSVIPVVIPRKEETVVENFPISILPVSFVRSNAKISVSIISSACVYLASDSDTKLSRPLRAKKSPPLLKYFIYSFFVLDPSFLFEDFIKFRLKPPFL